jgi:diguanylate cyclase (GGDEF)-like protein
MRKSIINTLQLILIISCTTAILALPAYFIYQNTKSIIVDELGKSAISIAATISEFAEINLEKYLSIPNSSFENSEAAVPRENDGRESFENQLTDIFADLMQATGAQSIYIEKKLSDENKGYLFYEGYPDKSRHLISNKLTQDELIAFNNGILVPSSVLNDETVGEYIAGYAPIKNPFDNIVVGIVVVEFSLNHVQKITDGLKHILFFSFGVIILLTAAVVSLLLKSRQKYYEKDCLTQLCNKNYFEKRLKMHVLLSRETHKPLSLIMIDIDYFKAINDHFGHPAGDTVLKSVSETIRAQTRDTDLCARYGGDEFVVLLNNSDAAQADAIAERILQKTAVFDHLLEYTVEHSADYPAEHPRLFVTLSVGVAQLEDNMNPEDLMEAADQAMYISKNTGKNKVTRYQPDTRPYFPCLQQARP